MNRRILAILLAAGLVASVMATASAVRAQEVREVPADPNIVDDKQDSNYLTPQGGPSGGAYHARGDIWAGWFTVDDDSIYAHIQAELPGQSATFGYFYRVRVDPGAGETCLWFQGRSPPADVGEPTASLRNLCDGDETTEAEFLLEQAPDESGVFTIKVPRSAHPAFAPGSVLATPWAEVTQLVGGSSGPALTAPPIDVTETGRDYTVPGDEKVKEKPPGKKDPPGKGKKKGCKKGKGKKKGACPGKKKKKPSPPVLACAPYEPGEQGAEAETTVVTDAATEEAPVEVEIDAPMGLPEQDAEFGDAHVVHNIQVDSSNSEAGLYVRYEFQERRDYDLFLNYASGGEAARAAGFNTAPEGPLDGTGNGGHSETNAEQIDGLRSPDCQGYTARLSTYLGEGGSLVLKLWLGEIQNDPAPDQRALVATVFGLF